MIVDKAEVSDDEEDHGDYQLHRLNEESEIEALKVRKSGNWFDQYQLVRKSEKRVELS